MSLAESKNCGWTLSLLSKSSVSIYPLKGPLVRQTPWSGLCSQQWMSGLSRAKMTEKAEDHRDTLNERRCLFCENMDYWGEAPIILEMLCPAAAHWPGPAPAHTKLREVIATVPRGSDQRQRPLVTLTPRRQEAHQNLPSTLKLAGKVWELDRKV